MRADGREGLPLSYIHALIAEVIDTAVRLRDPQTADVLEKSLFAAILAEVAGGHPQSREMACLLSEVARCRFPRLVDQLLHLSEAGRTTLFTLLNDNPKQLDTLLLSAQLT